MQGNPARNANESAPGARTNDWPDFLAMKEPGEGVAARAGEVVDDQHLWSVNRHGWTGGALAFAWGESGEQLTAKFFRIKIRNLPTGIVTLVDNDAVLIELRGELLVERDNAGERGIRHVHVPDAAAGGFRDFAAVFLHPIEVTRTGFTVRWLDGDFPCTFGSGLGIDFQRDEFSRQVLKIGIYVLIRTRFLAVHSDQKVARHQLQCPFGQRRARRIIATFAM